MLFVCFPKQLFREDSKETFATDNSDYCDVIVVDTNFKSYQDIHMFKKVSKLQNNYLCNIIKFPKFCLIISSVCLSFLFFKVVH